MLAPLRAALVDRRPDDRATLRQVVFITDGAIGDEQRLFDAIAAGLGRSRLFMVAIGSAPNGFLMARAAELGRGSFADIGSTEQVEARMRELFDKLGNPAATGLTAAFSAGGGELTPDPLPDLYHGEPLVLVAKLPAAAGTLELAAAVDGRPWRATLALAGAAEGAGLAKLWARRRIADAEVARTLRRLAPEAADARILALALEHGLASRLTSLVAVDRTPARPEGAPLDRAELPLNLPAGWEPGLIFRPRPQAAPPERLQPASAQAPAEVGLALPLTATNAELRLLAGLLLCSAALLLAAAARLRRHA
jgi:Ca-activated chloride channel family protein